MTPRLFAAAACWIAVPVAVLCALQYSQSGVQPRPVASLLILLVVALLVTYTVRRKFWFLAEDVVLDDVAQMLRPLMLALAAG